MEPTSDNTFTTTEPAVAGQQPAARTSYHDKKRIVLIVIAAVVLIAVAVLAWLYWKKHHGAPQSPEQVLTSLAASSQPVQKTADDRSADMKALEVPPPAPKSPLKPAKPQVVTAETRLQMFDSLNTK